MADHNKTLMISGYYGFDNAGDEAILASMVQQFREKIPGVRIIVLSENPDITSARYQVESFYRRDFAGIFRLMRKIDLFISGGGGLVQDSTGFATVVFYLGMVQMARLLGKKTMLYGQGFGPLHQAKSRFSARFVMNQASLITYRDEDSKKLSDSIGIVKPPVHVTGDPVFALKPAEGAEMEQAASMFNIEGDKLRVGISVRPWQRDEAVILSVAETADSLAEKHGAEIFIFPFQFSQDMDICKKVAERMKSPATMVDRAFPPDVLMGLLGRMDFTLGMRLHSLIFSGAQGVPSVGISYDPKVQNTMNRLGLPWIDINDVTPGTLADMADRAFSQRFGISEEIRKKASLLREKAMENTNLLLELLNK